MRDGPGRRLVKGVALGVYSVRLALHRFLARRNGEIRYELGGACVRCAKCCEEPGIQVGRLTWYVPPFRRLFLWWHEHVNGFELEEVSRAERAFLFRCTHFDWASRSCDSYESRPGMCRDYPRVYLEQANPEFFEGCGFKALARNRTELVAALEAQSLAPEQLERLKKGLYLEE